MTTVSSFRLYRRDPHEFLSCEQCSFTYFLLLIQWFARKKFVHGIALSVSHSLQQHLRVSFWMSWIATNALLPVSVVFHRLRQQTTWFYELSCVFFSQFWSLTSATGLEERRYEGKTCNVCRQNVLRFRSFTNHFNVCMSQSCVCVASWSSAENATHCNGNGPAAEQNIVKFAHTKTNSANAIDRCFTFIPSSSRSARSFVSPLLSYQTIGPTAENRFSLPNTRTILWLSERWTLCVPWRTSATINFHSEYQK